MEWFQQSWSCSIDHFRRKNFLMKMTKEIKGLLIYVQFLYVRQTFHREVLLNKLCSSFTFTAFTRSKSDIKKCSKVCNMLKRNNKKTTTCWLSVDKKNLIYLKKWWHVFHWHHCLHLLHHCCCHKSCSGICLLFVFSLKKSKIYFTVKIISTWN